MCRRLARIVLTALTIVAGGAGCVSTPNIINPLSGANPLPGVGYVPYTYSADMFTSWVGCMRFAHPIKPPPLEVMADCKASPDECRNHVHVFFIHGMDPFDFANLEGVRDYVQSLGFIKTHYGQLYHSWKFRDEVRHIHHQDPDARFVLIGFSFGANMVRNVANAVRDDGVVIDLLVYLGGNTLENIPSDRPDHCMQIVNILAAGCIWNGATMDGAQNYHFTNVWHFGSPTHHGTLEILARELALVAARVPIYLPAQEPAPEGAPRPRPLANPPALRPKERQDWGFLEPGPDPAVPMTPDNKFARPSPVYRPAEELMRPNTPPPGNAAAPQQGAR
jgi:hypothetical protein